MKIVIVGNGVAGISCALAARKRDLEAEIVVVSKETPYFFSRTALMYAYMDMMQRPDLEPHERSMYENQNIQLIQDEVVDLHSDRSTISLRNKGELTYDRLVLALGASPNMFPWKGADQVKDGIVHFVSMQDLDNCERLTPTTQSAVVVGGGLIGIELAECLAHHGVQVTFLIREPYFWPVALGAEEASYVTEHMRDHGIDVRYGEEIASIEADASGRVSAIKTNKGNTLAAQMLGICVGVKPQVEVFKEATTPPKIGRGIVVDETLATSLPNVFACGDCAEIHFPNKKEDERPLIELIWYSAKRQGELVGRNLFGDAIAYRPPLFFNSSKFFEIEYTTVGQVMQLEAGTPTIYLKHPTKHASVRIVHKDDRVLGFNMLGSRWDHNKLEQWVNERRSPEYCLKRLKSAQYDVEFGHVSFAGATSQSIALAKA